jgi:hypothetical protein
MATSVADVRVTLLRARSGGKEGGGSATGVEAAEVPARKSYS